MNSTGSNLKLLEKKPELNDLMRTVISNRFVDTSGKSLKFLQCFSSYFHEYDWAYAFKIKKNSLPYLLSYHPMKMIKRILEFNSRIDLQAIIEKGWGYHIKFDFDMKKKDLSIGEKNNRYFFFPIFHASDIDPRYYYLKETPTAGFIFYNSAGFLKEPMFNYEDFQTLVNISCIIYKDIISESTSFSIPSLKDGIRDLIEANASQTIIQDFLLRALYAGRTQWNWDILGNALMEIMDKVDNHNNVLYTEKLKDFLEYMLSDLRKVQEFAKTFIETYRSTGNINLPLKTVLERTFKKYASDDLKFLHHTRNFLKDFRLEYLNLSQVGAVVPQEVMAKSKSKNLLAEEIGVLCEKILEINRILFEHQS
jgi:hypothetical protein